MRASTRSTYGSVQNRLDHTLDGKDPGDRIKDVGYPAAAWGENVAMGARTPEEALRIWMKSPGHKANILKGDFTQLGVGIAKSADGSLYYAQVFGTPRER